MENVLRKSPKEERKFLGVCGGISRFLDPEMDPFIIRLTTVILTFLWPPMLLAYFIAAIFLKTHDAPFSREQWIKDYVKKHNVEVEIRVKGKKVTSSEEVDEILKEEDIEEKDVE